jgi:hypothetical protein
LEPTGVLARVGTGPRELGTGPALADAVDKIASKANRIYHRRVCDMANLLMSIADLRPTSKVWDEGQVNGKAKPKLLG